MAIPMSVVRLNSTRVSTQFANREITSCAGPRDGQIIREAGAEFFPARNPPASVLIGVQSLPMDGLLIAVDATAIVRAMFRPLDERERP